MAGLLWSVIATISVASVLLVVLRQRASWFATSMAFTSGIAAGQLAWIASNEYLAAGEEANWRSVLSSTIETLRDPREASDWLVPILLVGQILVLIVSGVERGGRAELVESLWRRRIIDSVWVLLFSGVLLRLLWGSVYLKRRWSLGEAVVMVAMHVLPWGLVMASGQAKWGARIRAIQWPFASMVALAASAVIGMSGSAVYAQMMVISSVGFLVVSIFAWVRAKHPESDRLPVVMVSLVLAVHLWLAHFFAELKLVDGALLIGAWFAIVLYGPASTRSTQWARLALGTAFLAMAVAVAHSIWTLRQALSESVGY